MRTTVVLLALCLSLVGCSSPNKPANDVPVNEGLSTAAPAMIGSTESPTRSPAVADTGVPVAGPTAIPSAEPTTAPSAEPATGPASVSVEQRVLLDQDGIVITLNSLDMDGWLGPELKVLVENKRDNAVTVQTRDSSVNGVMVDAMFSCDVAPGKKANDEITLAWSYLEAASIQTIKDIELAFHVFEKDSWDDIFDSQPVVITTSADPAFAQTYDDSGFVAVDQNGIRMVIKKLDSEESFWGADVYVYVENNSQRDITVQLRDVSVNGFMIEPSFSCDVLAGKKAFDTVTFLESDLTENDIRDIDTMEFRVLVFDADEWEDIFLTEPVTVSFAE